MIRQCIFALYQGIIFGLYKKYSLIWFIAFNAIVSSRKRKLDHDIEDILDDLHVDRDERLKDAKFLRMMKQRYDRDGRSDDDDDDTHWG